MSKYILNSAFFVAFAIAVISSCGNGDNTCDSEVKALKSENDGLKAQIDSLNEQAVQRAKEAKDYATLAALIIVRRPPISPPPSPCELALNCIPNGFKPDMIRFKIGKVEFSFTEYFEKFNGKGPLREEVDMFIPNIDFKGLDEPPMNVKVER